MAALFKALVPEPRVSADDWYCHTCGCLFHPSWTRDGEPIPCAEHGCVSYSPSWAHGPSLTPIFDQLRAERRVA